MRKLKLLLAVLAAGSPVAACTAASNHEPAADAPAADAPGFAAKVDFATGSNPEAVAIGDFNGDGKPDLVVASTNAMAVSVLLNTTASGALAPSFAAKVDFPAGMGPVSIAIGDLNGDGKPDLAVANVGANTVSVLINTTAPGAATPSFAATVDFPTGASPEYVAFADIDGCGRPELAVANFGSNTVSILLDTTPAGGTTPSFAAKVDFPTGEGPVAIAVGDLDGDGRPDLAVANLTSNTVSLLRDAGGSELAAPTYAAKVDFPTGAGPNSVAIGDLDGDGRPDVAVANRDETTVSLLFNTTATGATVPSCAAKVDVSTGAGPNFVAIGDLDGDGRADLATANFGSDTVSVVLDTAAAGASTPSFAASVDYATGAKPRTVAIGDFDGDGKADLVIGNTSSSSVSVLLAR